MYLIKLVNEQKDAEEAFYNGPVGLLNLIRYAFSPQKTFSDSIRNIYCLQEFTGCEPFPYDREFEHDPDTIYGLMMVFHNAYGCSDSNMAKHRVVSFECSDYIIPCDLDSLGRSICQMYANYGYIAAYSVHQDSYQCHMHIIVCTTSYLDGHRFHIKDELAILNNIAGRWYEAHNTRLLQDIDFKEFREKNLYGICPYGNTSLSSKEQITLNKKTAG